MKLNESDFINKAHANMDKHIQKLENRHKEKYNLLWKKSKDCEYSLKHMED